MAEHFMELLCPAGNMDKLKMAIRYGADAVYCAGKRFGCAQVTLISPTRN